MSDEPKWQVPERFIAKECGCYDNGYVISFCPAHAPAEQSEATAMNPYRDPKLYSEINPLRSQIDAWDEGFAAATVAPIAEARRQRDNARAALNSASQDLHTLRAQLADLARLAKALCDKVPPYAVAQPPHLLGLGVKVPLDWSAEHEALRALLATLDGAAKKDGSDG